MKHAFKLLAGIAAVLGVGSAVADTTTFHTDFDEADLASTGLTIDTPSTDGPDSGTISLNTANHQLDFTAYGANMWTLREGAPIAWVAAPTVEAGETWFVETQVNMINGEAGNAAQYKQAGITFYDGTPGANPGDEDAPFLVLNDWNNWNVNAQAFTIGGGQNSGSPDLGEATGAFLRIEITEGAVTNSYNYFYKINEGDAWTRLTGWAENQTSVASNSVVGLFLKSHNNNTTGAAQFDYLSVGLVINEGATVDFDPLMLSMDLDAPGPIANGTITASYSAGTVTSNDIEIVSLTADAGFTAAPVADLGTGNPTEDITVTFDNSGIGLTDGESTNSTLEIVWTELGSGVSNTSSIPVDVTFVNKPNSIKLTPASLSMTLKYPDTSINGTMVVSYTEGTIPADIEIISITSTNSDFSVDQASFTLSTNSTSEDVMVTYVNSGALMNNGDTANSTAVVTWTVAGSGVTNTANVTLSVSYYKLTYSTTVIAGFDFDANTDDGVQRSAMLLAENVTASLFSGGAGLNNQTVDVIGDNSGVDASGVPFGTSTTPGYEGTMGISVAQATTTNFADAVAANDYYTFTVTPDSGFEINLTDISFKASKSSVDSVDEYAVTDSQGNQIGSSATITTMGQVTAYEGVIIDLSAPEFQNITEPTEFRIYAWGRGTTSTGGTLAMLDKVVLKGTVGSGAVPSFSATVSDGSLIMSWETSAPFNVLTNVDLVHGEWGVSQSNVTSPVTNAVGNAPQVFYTLGK
ncbi:hypothetical protein P4C99_08960 [Pontiellaceae bacterium B1224]|nr:hypothetical protein [Pontiellaceae bacterium B1224]